MGKPSKYLDSDTKANRISDWLSLCIYRCALWTTIDTLIRFSVPKNSH